MPFVAAWGEAAAGTGVGPAGLLEGGAGALADLQDVDGASAPDSQGAAGLVALSASPSAAVPDAGTEGANDEVRRVSACAATTNMIELPT